MPIAIAKNNVDHIFKFNETNRSKLQLKNKVVDQPFQDALSILVIMIALNCHIDVVRLMTNEELATAHEANLEGPQNIVYANRLYMERCGTFIMARK